MPVPKIDSTHLFKTWQHWPIKTRPVLIKEFTQGKNHHCYLIASGNEKLVLKHATASQKPANDAQSWANKLGIAPKVLFSQDDYCLTLMEYIVEQGKPNKKIKQNNIAQLAYALKTLHSEPSRPVGFDQSNLDLNAIFKQYLSACNDQIHYIHQQLTPALELFVNDQTPYCFCHNDLVTQNCLFNTKATLIDWEFAHNNNPWFDLASVIVYHELNYDDATHFLTDYGNSFTQKINMPIFYASQITVLWLDILWHCFKFSEPLKPTLNRHYQRLVKLAKQLNIDLSLQG